MKRIFLFVLTNLAVAVVLGIVANLLGVNRFLTPNGLDLTALLGFALIVWGFGQARMQPVLVWSPPAGMRHAASLLTLLAFVLLAAA